MRKNYLLHTDHTIRRIRITHSPVAENALSMVAYSRGNSRTDRLNVCLSVCVLGDGASVCGGVVRQAAGV